MEQFTLINKQRNSIKIFKKFNSALPQAEDGIRDRSPSRGLGDVYKRQNLYRPKWGIIYAVVNLIVLTFISLFKDSWSINKK